MLAKKLIESHKQVAESVRLHVRNEVEGEHSLFFRVQKVAAHVRSE